MDPSNKLGVAMESPQPASTVSGDKEEKAEAMLQVVDRAEGQPMQRARSSRLAEGGSGLTSRLSRALGSHIPDPSERKTLVEFAKGDKEDPFQFALAKKWLIFGVMALQSFWVLGISTFYAAVVEDVAADFQVSNLAARIPLATYLLGFSIGPVILIPLSEDYGRKPIYTVCLFLLYILQIPCALAPNLATLIVVRLIGGMLASPIFNSLNCIPDMWDPRDPVSGWALNGWAFVGESVIMGTLIGGAISNQLGYRWIFWMTLIVGMALLVLYVVLVPETRQGPILSKRAKRLRRETGDQGYYAEHEVLARRSLREILEETVIRPVYMLFTEPIVWVVAIWDGFNYALLYLLLSGVTLIYAQYGFSDIEAYTALSAFIVGYVIAICTYPLAKKNLARIERERGGECPEGQLWWTKYGGILFPLSLYWIAATCRPPVPWIVSVLGIGVFAISSHIIFLVASEYTVYSYGVYASSAITGQSFAREIGSASLALVADLFFEGIGGPRYLWPVLILAFIATPMAAIPFVFDRLGPEIRRRSKFAVALKEARKPSSEMDRSGDPSPARTLQKEDTERTLTTL